MAGSTPASDSVDAPDATTEEPPTKLHSGFRFWAIMVVLSLVSLLTALEGTITSTVLPSVVVGLNGGDDYIWISNAYLLTAAALQPMFGQLANVFGRRWPMIFSTVIFVVGSGICGGATNMGMMIAGRAIQGVGGSGISVLCEIVICDLVPLRERGTYLAFVFGMVAIGSALGPLFGGLLVSYSTSGWRWAFYLSLPVGGFALVLLFIFLHVKYDKSQTLATKLSSLDWLGNAIFIGGSVPILIALSWAGGHYSWSSYQVLVPLIVGLATLGGFIVFESKPRLAPNPMMPTYLFTHSISFIIFLLTFLHGIATFWALFFLPVYFQGVLGETPYRSGIMLLPTILALLPAAMVGGLVLSKFGRYKPLIIISFALMIVGFGLFSILDENSSIGAWVGFQVVESVGAGICIATFLPALLAPLSDRDTALATATWAFMRSFGITWGVAIAGAVHSNRAAQLAEAGAISDPTVAAGFAAGHAYGYASDEFLDSVPVQLRAEVVSVQSRALQRSWQVAIAFGAVGFIGALVLKQIPLRKELETNDFGMVEKKSDSPAEETGVAGAETREVETKEVKAPTSTP